MIIILGLVVLVAAVVIGVAGVLVNHGSDHALVHPFAVFGYHVTGSTGVLKPKGGPKVKFVIESLIADRELTELVVIEQISCF